VSAHKALAIGQAMTEGLVKTNRMRGEDLDVLRDENRRLRVALSEIARETGTPYARIAQAALDYERNGRRAS
jgi:hypothetical protein